MTEDKFIQASRLYMRIGQAEMRAKEATDYIKNFTANLSLSEATSTAILKLITDELSVELAQAQAEFDAI